MTDQNTRETASALDLVDVLTLGELAQAEELSGTSINALSSPKQYVVPLLTALVCVAARRSDPTFSMNQAEAVTGKRMGEIFAAIATPTAPPPPAVTSAPAGGGDDPEG